MSRATTRLVLEPFGHVAADDALGQALDDGGLADAGLADQHRVVLGAPRQHLDDAANLLVAADDRIELALRGQLGQVAAIAFQGLDRSLPGLGVVTRWLPRTSCRAVMKACAVDAEFLEDLAGGAAVVGHGQQEMLDGDVFVLELLGLVLGLAEQAIEPAGDADVVARRAGDARQLFQLALDASLTASTGISALVKIADGQPVLLIEQRQQQMLDVDLLMIQLGRQPLGGLQRFLRFFGEAIHVHSGCLL